MVKPAKSSLSAERARARITRQWSRRVESIAVMVTLGSPKRNCAGHGICRVDGGQMRADTLSVRPCQSAAAIADPVVNGRLQLHFEKASLCAQAQRKHFGKADLQVNEPASVCIPQWGQSDRYIQPGKYAITESEHYYTVCFELGQGQGRVG